MVLSIAEKLFLRSARHTRLRQPTALATQSIMGANGSHESSSPGSRFQDRTQITSEASECTQLESITRASCPEFAPIFVFKKSEEEQEEQQGQEEKLQRYWNENWKRPYPLNQLFVLKGFAIGSSFKLLIDIYFVRKLSRCTVIRHANWGYVKVSTWFLFHCLFFSASWATVPYW